jgi:hypothetical protein
MTFKDRLKYGKVIEDINLGDFHVSGPVDETKRAIGAKYDLSGLVDPDLIREDGQIIPTKFATRGDYIKFMRRVGQAYLDKRFNFEGSVIPINSDHFILPLDSDILTKLIHKIGGLEEVSFSGDVKHPIDKTSLNEAQQYLKDLLLWRLDFYNSSYRVRINVQERTQKEKTSGIVHGLRKNFIVNRDWSKANKFQGVWKVVAEDGEKVIISGYQPK